MECFIIENGVERKADLEDLLPIIGQDRTVLQRILGKARTSGIDLAKALAFLSDETKELVYSNVSSWFSGELRKARYDENDFVKHWVQGSKTRLIELIGECSRWENFWIINYPENIIWKGVEPQKETTATTPLASLGTETGRNTVKGASPLSAFERLIKSALGSGCLDMTLFIYEMKDCKIEMLHDAIQKVLQNHMNELQKIRRLKINGKNLPAIALLFQTGEIEELSIYGEVDGAWPSFLEKCQTLAKLTLRRSEVSEFPSWIRNAASLRELQIDTAKIASLPDWIGELQSLTKFSLLCNEKLKALPDSIGNLKNLVNLDLGYSPIEKLPDTIVNCAALETVSILGTKITSVPDFISSLKNFTDNILFEVIPQGRSISYPCFCNAYYRLVKIILRFKAKAWRQGILALEDELDYFADDLFKQGMRLVLDGTDHDIIRQILTIKLEREHNFYRRKLMEVATEGILSIQASDDDLIMVLQLSSLVDIKNNPLDTACVKYFAGDADAISNIDFEAAMLPEDEREEVRLIKRAVELSVLSRREGLTGLEKRLDYEGIARRDVFEYGLPLVVDGWEKDIIKKILDNLIEFEKDPVQRNIAQAKKEAILSISDGINTRVLFIKLCAYFDKDIAEEAKSCLD